jgi:octaprenyl-diphosphate synthase
VNSFILNKAAPPYPDDIKERIYAEIRPDLDKIEAEIKHNLTTSIPLIAVVGRYILGSGGKRLRPLLMILSARLCGYQGNRDASLAVVFEFIHAASLLHDDVVDRAEFRRNQPAANTVWDNPAVVLVGDFLYSKSFLMAIEYDNIKILHVLSDATTKMSEGEVLQLVHADNLEVDEFEYYEVITRKTAVLISAACRIGAIFGGGDGPQEEALRKYGHHLGIAFQLVDDTLDYTGDIKEMGKPVGNDIQEGKATLPLIHALNHGKASDKNRLRKIFNSDEISQTDFKQVRDIVVQSGGIEYTLLKAVEHVEHAKESLGIFPDQRTKKTLLDIADYVICRRT